MSEDCQTLTLSAGTMQLTLTPSGPELTLMAMDQPLTLLSDCCSLTLHSVEEVLTFSVTDVPLVLSVDTIDLTMGLPIPVGTGEANTGANCGTDGVCVFKTKQGVVLVFRRLRSLSDAIEIEEKDCSIDFDLNLDALGAFKYNIEPSGEKDGINVVYLLPDLIKQETLRLYRNGQRQRESATGDSDFTIEESGGVGSGFDLIEITSPTLLSWEQLTADYQVGA